MVQLGGDAARRCARVAQPADLGQYSPLPGIVFDVHAIIGKPVAKRDIPHPLTIGTFVIEGVAGTLPDGFALPL